MREPTRACTSIGPPGCAPLLVLSPTGADLPVATVFTSGQGLPITKALQDLTGSYGQSWELLTAGAFISIVVPLIVFFSLQRFFVRGLLAGATKG